MCSFRSYSKQRKIKSKDMQILLNKVAIKYGGKEVNK